MKNLDSLHQSTKEERALLRRAENVAHIAIESSYTHFYKTEAPYLTKTPLPLDTLYSSLAITWCRVISEIAQSFIPRQELLIGAFTFVFDAELCVVHVTPTTCFFIPYSLILCFSDMCASWFSLDCYACISNKKYPGFSLSNMVRACLRRMHDVVEHHNQKDYLLFKMWPSLVKGSILRDIELAPEFLSTITEDIPLELKNTAFFSYETGTIQSPAHAMLCLKMADMWKTMGHPIVNMNMSASNWMKKGMVMKKNLGPAAESISNMFKKEFCRQFYKVH